MQREGRITAKLLPAALLLLLFAGLIAAHRHHGKDEPLERDITSYAIIAHELLAGGRLYSELWDHKPPAVYLTYAVAELLAGYGPESVYALNVFFSVVTLIAVFVAAFKASRLGGAFWAGLAWVALSGDLALQANQPNTEVFINAFLTWIFVIFVYRSERLMSWQEVLIVGLLASVASLYKHVAVVPVFCLAAFYVAWPPNSAENRRAALLQMTAVVAVVCIAWFGMMLYFKLTGDRLGALYDALFLYNWAYAGSLLETAIYSLNPLCTGALCVALLPMGFAVVNRKVIGPELFRLWKIYSVACVGTYVAIMLPGQFFAHYFQLLLPLLSIAAGWSLLLFQTAGRNFTRIVPHCVVGLVVVPVVLYETSFLRFPAEEWSERKYGSEFISTYAQARELDELLRPDETFYEWGQDTGLYFASRRRPPSGVFFYDALVGGPLQHKLSMRVLNDLDREKPEILVVPSYALHYFIPVVEGDAGLLLDYLDCHYVIFPDSYQGAHFVLFARRNGRIHESF